MATLLASLSIISSVASIAGLIIQIFGFESKTIRAGTVGAFIFALLFSCYMIIVPGTSLVQRVEDKLRYYKTMTDNDVLVEEGTFSDPGMNTLTIEFPETFRDIPEVHILNIHGYDKAEVPAVERVTNHYFDVRRYGLSGTELTPKMFQEYKWIAQGTPFKDTGNKK